MLHVSPHRYVPTGLPDATRWQVLVRRGFLLEYLTLGWNVAGIVVLAIAAISARPVALAGFGLDSLAAREIREIFFAAGT